MVQFADFMRGMAYLPVWVPFLREIFISLPRLCLASDVKTILICAK